MYDLYKSAEASTLKEVKESFIDNKDDWYGNKSEAVSRALDCTKVKGDFTRVETKSSLGLNFW